ncbi:MAG: PilZ domain-containing protein [Planctomycetes bacterium]|nr:PilZ domain-containing protein [Planctomycetota bacterium]
MSQPPKLRLVDQNQNDDALRFERRGNERHRITGRATALSKDTALQGTRNCIRSVQLQDISDTGLGAVSQDPIPINSQIAVFLPPHGPDQGLDINGVVVRCVPYEHGHLVGIKYETRQAA